MSSLFNEDKYWVWIYNDRTPLPHKQSLHIGHLVPMLDQKNEQRMQELLSQGVPFVVNGMKLWGTYDPKYSSNKYHGDPCKIHFIEQGSTKETTVNEFFSTFSHLCAPEARAKLIVIPTILSLHSWSNSLVGLAPRETFLNKIHRALRHLHSHCSIPGHHGAKWCTQSGSSFSHQLSSTWLR